MVLLRKCVKYITLVSFAFLTLALTACSDANNVDEDGRPSTLYVAIVADDGNAELDMQFSEFSAAMSAAIGIPVVMVPGVTHLPAIEGMRAGNLHLIWGSPFVYLLAQQTMDVERLVVTSSPNATNRALFITSNEDIQSIDDMADHTFGFVNAASASGFLYPMYFLINYFGYTRDEILTPGVLFSEAIFAGSNNAAISGAAHGDFDAAAVGHIQFFNAIRAGLIDEDAVRIVGYTPNIPFPGYIANKELPEDLRRDIQDFLLGWGNEEYSRIRFNGDPDVRYVRPDESEIDHLRSMVAILDIDLEQQG